MEESKADKWQRPAENVLKLNVDASYFPEAETFTIGMVIHDHTGTFIKGKTLALPSSDNLVEAESMGVTEALSWIKTRGYARVVIEMDSLLTVHVYVVGLKIY